MVVILGYNSAEMVQILGANFSEMVQIMLKNRKWFKLCRNDLISAKIGGILFRNGANLAQIVLIWLKMF